MDIEFNYFLNTFNVIPEIDNKFSAGTKVAVKIYLNCLCKFTKDYVNCIFYFDSYFECY